MTFTTRDVQARCASLGFDPGPIDGIDGRRTRRAVAGALEAIDGARIPDLFHHSGVRGICLHWTAGAYGVIGLEAKRYNGLVDQDGKRHQGRWSVNDQVSYKAGVRGASHTLNFNTGRPGLACDAMAGAREVPFDKGSAPLTWDQLDEFTLWSAEWCATYNLPVNVYSVYTHAEVQRVFGVRQRFKWDITWLPDMARPGDPIAVGNRLREMISDKMDLAAVRRLAA